LHFHLEFFDLEPNKKNSDSWCYGSTLDCSLYNALLVSLAIG